MDFPLLRRHGFRVRLLAFAMLLHALLAAGLTWHFEGEAIRVLEKETERRARDVSALIAALLEPSLAGGPTDEISPILHHVMQRQALDYIAAFDAEGRLIDAAGWQFSQPFPPPTRSLLESVKRRYDMRVPLAMDGRRLGEVQFGLVVPDWVAAQRHRLNLSLAAGLLASLLAGLVLVPFGLRMTRRLSQIEETGSILASGDLSVRLAEDGDDELARLAGFLNRMAENLSQRLQALDASERRLAGVIRGTSDAFFDWEAATGRTYYSPRLGAMLGYAPDDYFDAAAMGLELVHEDDRERFNASRLAHVKGDSRQFDCDCRLRRKDGSDLWCHIRGLAERRDDGFVTRFSGSITDINEQKIAEERAAHLVAEQKALLDNAVAGIVHIRNRTIIYCNRRFEEIFGFGPGEALGISTREISVDDEHFRSSGERIYPVLKAGETYSADTTMRRRDGSLFSMSSSGRLIDPAHPELGSIWIYQDRSEQQKILAALSTEKLLVDALINSLPGIFFQTDRHYRLLRWNRNLENLTGRSAVSLRLAPMLDIIAPEWRPLVAMQADRCIANRSPSQTETWLQSDDDARHPFLLSFAVAGEGEAAQLLGTGMDISDRRQAEAEVRRINETLEQRVRERTADLTAANQELEAFSYSVSHDLSAPLRAIDGFARIVVEDYAHILDAPALRYLERVRAASQRMHVIIDDMLALSRITRNDMHAADCDLSALASASLADLQVADPERRVTTHVAPDLPVWGDPVLLRIAIDNLLRNAWKFTRPRDEPTIEVGKMANDSEPVYFVRDNGVGFDMRYAGKLFTAFQRLHQQAEFEGSGIGLAIVSRVIQRHGGRIWVEAAPEKGATFYFTLQRKDVHHGSAKPDPAG